MIYKFVIPGKPFGKERPRKSRGLRALYTPRKTALYEACVRSIATKQAQMLEKPLRVDITAVFDVPKSYSKKRKKACLEGLEYPTKKPDKDNIEKIILDGLNPVFKLNKAAHKKEMVAPGFYKDDAQVIDGFTKKIYGKEPHIEVVVTELGEKDD